MSSTKVKSEAGGSPRGDTQEITHREKTRTGLVILLLANHPREPQPATRAIIRPVGSTGQIQVES